MSFNLRQIEEGGFFLIIGRKKITKLISSTFEIFIEFQIRCLKFISLILGSLNFQTNPSI